MKNVFGKAFVAMAIVASGGAFASDYKPTMQQGTMHQGTMQQGAMHQGMEKKSEQSASFYATVEPASGDPTRVLNLDRAQIRSVQNMLHHKGYAAGPIDGIAGPRTAAAIMEFQQDKELSVTGQPNNETLIELGFRAAAASDRTRTKQYESDIMFDAQ